MHASNEIIPRIPASRIEYDEEGFLINPYEWDEELALQLATEEGIEALNGAHWQLIRFVRERYLLTGGMLPIRLICRQLGTERDAVPGLFGGCVKLWRIAGLPDPGEEARAYMV